MSRPIALMRVDGHLWSYYSCERTYPNPITPDIRWLLDHLSVEADEEMGIEAVVVRVQMSGGTVLDIRLNNKSIGYEAISTICRTFVTPQATLLEFTWNHVVNLRQAEIKYCCPCIKVLDRFGDAQ